MLYGTVKEGITVGKEGTIWFTGRLKHWKTASCVGVKHRAIRDQIRSAGYDVWTEIKGLIRDWFGGRRWVRSERNYGLLPVEKWTDFMDKQ